MYTGVRLRSNPDCGPLPPQECDLNLPFIESQLIAVPEPGAQTVSLALIPDPQVHYKKCDKKQFCKFTYQHAYPA